MPITVTDPPEGLDSPAAGDSARDAAELATLIRRLRRVEGQVGGLVRMLQAGRDCTDVVTQLAAASRALDRVGFLLVASELRKCAAAPSSGLGNSDAAAKATAVEKLFLTLA